MVRLLYWVIQKKLSRPLIPKENSSKIQIKTNIFLSTGHFVSKMKLCHKQILLMTIYHGALTNNFSYINNKKSYDKIS